METNLKAIELRDLWRRYKDERDEKARERLVIAYSPLVKYVAGRMSSGLPSHVEESDLISYGLLGLISAIERFEPEREIKFETFAVTRIKGSIIDELRSLDWVPRSVRTKAREIERANAKLEHEPTGRRRTRRWPTRSEHHWRTSRNRSRGSRTPPWWLSTSCGPSPTRPATRSRSWTRSRPAGRGPGAGDGHDRDEGPPGGRDRAAAGAGEAGRGPLLLREPDAPRDLARCSASRSRASPQLHTKAVLRLKSRLQGDPLTEPD